MRKLSSTFQSSGPNVTTGRFDNQTGLKTALCEILKFRPLDKEAASQKFRTAHQPATLAAGRRRDSSRIAAAAAAAGEAGIDLEASAPQIRANNSIAHVIGQVRASTNRSHPVALPRRYSHQH
jgi:hypothetical protein